MIDIGHIQLQSHFQIEGRGPRVAPGLGARLGGPARGGERRIVPRAGTSPIVKIAKLIFGYAFLALAKTHANTELFYCQARLDNYIPLKTCQYYS